MAAMHATIQELARRFGLTPAQTARLWALSGLHARPAGLGQAAERALAVLAALLLGAGLIFWVAANWQAQTRAVKLNLLQGALLLPVLAALLLPRLRTACLLLATLALGALLAFVGQTYQTGADTWELFAAWAALALPWALAVRRDGLWAAWTLVAGTGIWLWSAGIFFGFDADRTTGGQLARTLSLLPWAALFVWPLLLPRLGLLAGAAQAPRAVWAWRMSALLALGGWCMCGLSSLFQYRLQPHYLWCLLLAAAATALAWRRRPRDMAVLALGVLTLNLLLLIGAGRLLESSIPSIPLMLVMTLLSAACVGGSGVWLYRLQHSEEAA